MSGRLIVLEAPGGSTISTEDWQERLEIAEEDLFRGTQVSNLAAVSKEDGEGIESSTECGLGEKQPSGVAHLNGDAEELSWGEVSTNPSPLWNPLSRRESGC